jgi:hypothetical protein
MYENCAVNGTEWREEISSGMVKPEARQHALCCAGTEDANQKEGEQNESNAEVHQPRGHPAREPRG